MRKPQIQVPDQEETLWDEVQVLQAALSRAKEALDAAMPVVRKAFNNAQPWNREELCKVESSIVWAQRAIRDAGVGNGS